MDNKSIQPRETIWKNELLTVKEVADHLRVSRVTIWRWCQNGLIPAFQIGRHWRIKQVDLLMLETKLASEEEQGVSGSPSLTKNKTEEGMK